jgi:hypothetical protein
VQFIQGVFFDNAMDREISGTDVDIWGIGHYFAGRKFLVMANFYVAILPDCQVENVERPTIYHPTCLYLSTSILLHCPSRSFAYCVK